MNHMSDEAAKVEFLCPMCHQVSTQPEDALGASAECPHCRSPVRLVVHRRAKKKQQLPELSAEEVQALLDATPVNAANGETDVDKSSRQFSLGTLFSWITIVAILITTWRCASWFEGFWGERMLRQILMGGFGMMLIVIAIGFAIHMARLEHYGTATVGVIASYKKVKTTKRQFRYNVVIYFGTDQGVFKTEESWQHEVHGHIESVGKQVEVVYDPSNPRNARIDYWPFAAPFYIGLLGVIMVALSVFGSVFG